MVKSFHGQQRQNMITRALICEAALAPPSLFSLFVIHIQHALFSIPVSEQARALPDTLPTARQGLQGSHHKTSKAFT